MEGIEETKPEVKLEADDSRNQNGIDGPQIAAEQEHSEMVELSNGDGVKTEQIDNGVAVANDETKTEVEGDEVEARQSNKRKSEEDQHDEAKKLCVEEPAFQPDLVDHSLQDPIQPDEPQLLDHSLHGPIQTDEPPLVDHCLQAPIQPEELLLVPLEADIQTKLEREIEAADLSEATDQSQDAADLVETGEQSLDGAEIERQYESPDPSLPSTPNLQTDEKLPDESPEPETKEDSSSSASSPLDIHEKLREMGEISVKPVSKSDPAASTSSATATTSKRKEGESEVSVEIKKKTETDDSKRITNLRKNIREVMDENQLDATTLAAQRQESERLARVQVQQKIIRELQRQMAAERQNNRTQNRVLSLLQGQTSILKNNASPLNQAGNSSDMYVVKGVASEVTFKGSNFVDVDKISSGHLTPSVSIAPVSRMRLADDEEEPSDEESESDIEDKKDVVTIVDSSSENDCIVLSDDDEEFEEEPDDPHNSGLHVKDAYNIPDEKGRVLINIGHPENEEDLFLAPQIARIIKPHQIGGVRFLYDNIIESTERFSTSTGFGCILAHSMGLGKTLQVVCFCDIFLRHTNSKSILCILPINTLQNWLAEFNMWLPEDPEKSPHSAHGEVRPRNFKIFVLSDQQKTLTARSKVIAEWNRVGGVLLIGYELFRLLSLKLANKKKKGKKDGEKEKAETESHKRMMEDIYSALVRPGPDLVMCDEGHRIKNSHASISVALKQIRSKRRIVLTGYPLQNNLMEYWCMVDFVRPNYLGTKTEFSNMFERPIQNGQCIDSTPQDIKLMRYRAHVLHSLLVGFVQRRSHVVLQTTLPQKEEYVILVRMTDFQRKLYTTFMNDVVRTKAVPNPLKAFAVCCKIWNHPDVLYNFLKKREADLDLELEEVETETNSSASSTSNRGRKKGTPNKPKAVKKDGKTIPAIEVQPNQGKIPDQTEQASESIAEKVEIKTESPPTPESQPTTPAATPNADYPAPAAPPQSAAVNPQQHVPVPHVPNPPPSYQNSYNQYNPYEYDNYYGQQYGNMYPPPPPQHSQYPNQPYDQSPYMSPGGPVPQNNYWQSNYYGYNNPGTNSMNLDPYSQVDQSYASLVPKATESFEKSKPPSAEEKSSEIVDLDTKEIKTVEAPPPPPPPPTVVEEVVDEIKDADEMKVKEEPDDESSPAPAEKEKEKEVTKSNGKDDCIPYDWAVELMKGYVPDLLENSPKMEIFFRLLEESIKLGDRILVFSQSLLTLNLIERFLQSSQIPGFDFKWAKNSTYFRLDGSTSALEREKLINEFNANPNVHLFLVSTRAGSLGINLVGANRVVVFDASWNPCHDTQAVCRVYRYGQKKPCFVYRIVMDTCLEKKIYDRQINKQGMSDRVVDECNPDAHLSMKEVTNLCYDNDEVTELKDLNECKDKYLDLVMQKVIEFHGSRLSKEPFHHESLLVDRKEKKLSQAEKRLAQRGYEMEKRAAAKPAYVYHSMGTQYRVMKTPDGAIVHRPVASVRPMQAELGEKSHITRPGGVRPTRWIPAEVWQRQGMTAQEMTLPLDVVIPTSSGDKSNIVLKAGQKVMVLKSPKGIYMQLETGKIIAIRTSLKMAQSKEKAEDSEAGTSNSDELLMKPAAKEDQSSPIHQSSNSSFLPTGKQGYSFDASRNKPNETPMPPLQYKGSNMGPQNRIFSSNTTNNSKNFNVQNLIEGKTSNGQQNASVYSHTKGPDLSPSESNRNMQSAPAIISKSNLYNAATKMHYPRSNYSFTGALKQGQGPHGGSQQQQQQQQQQQSLLANVKPQQTHENKMWEQNRNLGGGNKNPPGGNEIGGGALPTITIDDDMEPPLREKVVYKPNLVERKSKAANSKAMQNAMSAGNYPGKSGQNKNIPTQHADKIKGSENSRQLQNVKPYNRQFNDPASETTRSKHHVDDMAEPPQQAKQNPMPSEMKSATARGKMPSIRNIPAPYPSICVPSSGAATSHSNSYNMSNYSQHPNANATMYSQDAGQQQSNNSTTPSYGDQNTQHQRPQQQESTEFSSFGSRTSNQHKVDANPSKTATISETNDKPQQQQQQSTPAGQSQSTSTHHVPPTAAAASAQQPEAQIGQPNSADLQYPNFSQSSNMNAYASVPSDPTYSYARSDATPYQPYPEMYSSGAPPNPYTYPPAAHQAAQQTNYPYNPYYDPQMYGSSVNPSYGNPSSIPAQQHNQYHYPGYQPPPGVPSHTTPDPYSSYYNYPPYPPQTGQWQQ